MAANQKKTILFVAWFALLGVGGFMISKINSTESPNGGDNQKLPPTPPPPEKAIAADWPAVLAHAAAPARGNANAQYTVVEFGDFECPQCGKMRPLIEKTMGAATTKASLLFVHRPFPTMHKYALQAAEASQVAASFGKFWPMYDQLFANQESLEPGFYKDYAAKIGINENDFKKVLATHKYQATVNAASAYCDKLGIETTPTIAIRDNKTGKVTAVSGADDITKIMNNPPWNPAPKTAGPPAEPSKNV